jgi:hypothetical protein
MVVATTGRNLISIRVAPFVGSARSAEKIRHWGTTCGLEDEERAEDGEEPA